MRNNGSNPFKLKCFLQRSPFNRIDHPPFSLESLDARYAFKGFSGLQMKNPAGLAAILSAPKRNCTVFCRSRRESARLHGVSCGPHFTGIDPLDFDSQWTRGGPLNAVEEAFTSRKSTGFLPSESPTQKSPVLSFVSKGAPAHPPPGDGSDWHQNPRICSESGPRFR